MFIDSHPLAKDKEQLALAKGKARSGHAAMGMLLPPDYHAYSMPDLLVKTGGDFHTRPTMHTAPCMRTSVAPCMSSHGAACA